MSLPTTVGGRGRRDPLRDGYVLASIVVVAVIAFATPPWFGVDARSYYIVRLPDPYYSQVYGGVVGFNYAPVVAQLLQPLTLLPWGIFLAVITAGNLLALWLLLGRWAVVGLLLPPVAIEMFAGNINLWIAVALAWSLRWPALWAVPILTKVAPGIGILWHLFRGEWRALGIAAVATGAIVAASFVITPSAWFGWADFLRGNAGMAPPPFSVAILPFLPRVVIAVALVAVGARTNRAWLIPVASVLAFPVIWPATFCLLLAIPRLLGAEVRDLEHRRGRVGGAARLVRHDVELDVVRGGQ
jgi:hypothetical protein